MEKTNSPFVYAYLRFLQLARVIQALPDGMEMDANEKTLLQVDPLKELIEKYQPNVSAQDLPFLMEFVLWALVEFKQLSKTKTADGLSFNDLYDNLLKGLS